MTDQLAPNGLLPRSCIRNQSRENLLKRTKIVLALPSYNRQRLSGIRRGWCPSRSQEKTGTERVIRSDSGVTHRLSLSARVVSAVDRQVKAKRQGEKRLWRLQNRHSAGTRKIRRSQAAFGKSPVESYFYPGIIWRGTLAPCPKASAEARVYLQFPAHNGGSEQSPRSRVGI